GRCCLLPGRFGGLRVLIAAIQLVGELAQSVGRLALSLSLLFGLSLSLLRTGQGFLSLLLFGLSLLAATDLLRFLGDLILHLASFRRRLLRGLLFRLLFGLGGGSCLL